ncbi:RPA-related protein RADX-like isoform X2 [Heptranchias perlo]|uniref:RPA-related protein RADX-like isoform X2 n=1 Tax=Heptranchias perlo TaxID=212740 RepID=UPI003559BDA5
MTQQRGSLPPSTCTKMAATGRPECAFRAMIREVSEGFCSVGLTLLCREPVAVLSVERYPREPESGRGLLEAAGGGAGPDLYDLSLTDGHCRLRATLRPSLNPLVRRNELRSGCELKDARFGVEYDERRVGGGGRTFVLLEAQVVVRGNGPSPPLLKGLKVQELQVFGDEMERHGPNLPIKAKRRYYLPLWDSANYYGEGWHRVPPGQSLDHTHQHEGSRGVVLRQLEGCISQKKKDHPPVTVRILRKCRLYHFGRPDRFSECPFQAKFLVADKSGSVTVVLWNSLCMDWYRRLEPGMVIRLHNYIVKESYATRMGQDPGITKEPVLELNLNPRNPAAEITVVSARNVREEWQLPALHYCFATRKELSALRPGDLCDVIGLVTFVGRQERIRNKERSEEFLVYRWVHLIDGTAPEPFILKLFTTSQPEIQAQISPCSLADNTVTFLVCTNVRVECKVIDPSGQTTFPYLLTTEYSQVYVNGYHQGKQYVKNPKVKEFIQWILSAKDAERDRLSRTQIGGCYSFPPLPFSERDYRREILGGCALTTMSELKQLLDQLEYREYRQVTVQGRIISVKYKSLSGLEGEEVPVLQSDGAECTGEPAIGGIMEFEESLDADLSSLSAGGGNSPVIPVMRTPLGKQVGLASQKKKRKRKGTTRRRKRTLPRLSKGSESSSEDETADHSLRTRVENPDSDRSPGEDLSFIRACQEFFTDLEDVEETPCVANPCLAQPTFSWTDGPWQREHIPHRGDISAMVARSFRFRDKAFLLRTFGLQPSSIAGTPADWKKKLEHCEPACCRGYYTLTILGLNEELSLDTVFFPIIPRIDYRASYSVKHDNSLVSILAHGGLSPRQQAHTDSTEGSSPSPGDILRSAAGLEKMLFIFVLDICSQGGASVEVVLNRAYVQHRAL